MADAPPLWMQDIQALAVPVIAGVGTWIALQQMYIERMKLQHDLFDRRYAVFQAVRQLLNEVLSNRVASDETRLSFVLGTSDAPFLFDLELSSYLEEFRKRYSNLHAINTAMAPLEPGAEKAAASAAYGQELKWLTDQIDGLTDKFRPFLQLDQHRRSMPRLLWWR